MASTIQTEILQFLSYFAITVHTDCTFSVEEYSNDWEAHFIEPLPTDYSELPLMKNNPDLHNFLLQAIRNRVTERTGIIQNTLYRMKAKPAGKRGRKSKAMQIYAVQMREQPGGNSPMNLDIIDRKFSQLFNNIGDAIVVTNINGTITDCNPAFLQLLGREKAEVICKPYSLYISPAWHNLEQSIIRKEVLRHLSSEIYEMELESKSGQSVAVLARSLIIYDDRNLPAEYWTILRAKTGNDLYERKLRETEERFLVVSEHAREIIYRCELLPEFGISYISPSITSILGYSPNELYTNWVRVFDIAHPEDAHIISMFLEDAHKVPLTFEMRLFDINRKIIWTEHRISKIYDENNNVKAFEGLARDISRNKFYEDELRDSEARFRSILENAPIGFYRTAPDGTIIYANPYLVNLLKYRTAEELLSQNLNNGNHYPHPEQRSDFLQAIQKYGGVYGYKSIWLAKDGEQLHIRETAIGIRGQESKSYAYIDGYIEDITKQVRTEEELRKTEFKYKTIADWTYDWEYWLSADNTTLFISPSVERITGYPSENFINDKYFLSKIIHPADLETWLEHSRFTDTKESGSMYCELDFRIITQSGDILWIQHICRKIFDDNGTYVGIRASNRNITDRVKANELIKILSTAVEQSPVSIVITNEDGTIEYANKSCYTNTGYSPYEVIGSSTRIFQSGKTPIALYEQLWQTILRGDVWNGQLENKRKNGELYWEESTIFPIFDKFDKITHFVAIKDEITTRKELEHQLAEYREKLEQLVEKRTAQLRDSEEKFRALAENVDDAIIRFDNRQFASYINPTVGVPPEGMSVSWYLARQIISRNFSRDLMQALKHALKTVYREKRKNRFEFQMPDSTWIDWMLLPEFDQDGNVFSVITSGRDITALKKYEEQVQQALKREKELNELKTRFISTASHEFRTPLASILTSAQLIYQFHDRWDDEKLSLRYNVIRESVDFITKLMDEVLIISKSESDGISVSFDRCNIFELMNGYIAEMSPTIKRGQSISHEHIGGEEILNVDKKILYHIVSNLISNAIKYSYDNGKIVIQTEQKDGAFFIRVQDFGIGIPAKDIPNIFSPFYRSGNVGLTEGTGLGLNIVQHMARQINAHVDVQSELNKGSIFEVTIPV
ncbi:MAG: PAS domain S-box protein [Ignavibacteria bacterium]|nr:PAS domain S-box protein [Ignavibacteria bacterium]